ncbi:MAG: helix-turn-helix domain-containing protein, partial [Candidatus Cybelea sp.]
MQDRGHEMARDFGALLRRYRLAAGLSQEALAERARLSPYGISALERGYRRTPQRETLELLVGALALNDEQRWAFETAARAASARGRDGAAVTVGPWLGAGSANLPLALTRFVGRGDQLDEIAALLREHRLVTITGAGGVGKTQTALRATTSFGDKEDAAVCFVELAPIGDFSLIATAIANALGLQEVANHPLRETLVAFLKNKTVLLLLDNCEHVIAEAATIADFLLHACPNLRILATSREPLRAGGERTYRLPSLAENEAAALFADRAQAADAHFTLTDGNGPIVGEICRRLGGIPLAIELAAAQVILAPLSSLAKELEDRMSIFIGGERTAPPRQQTMHAAIEWSYELLTTPEQRLFERLSIFAGGCTIEAARAVCEGDGIKADDVLPLISSLVRKSLLVVDLEGREPRYRLLEPFREYAREKLKARGGEAAVARRHLFVYLDIAASFAWREQHYTVYYGHPRDEIGNWRAAVRWALTERNDVLAGQRLVSEVVCLWAGTTPALSDARRWIPAALDLVDNQTPPDVIAKLRLAEAHLAMHLDHHTLQLASAWKAIEYYRGVGDELNLLRAQTDAGNALFDLERYDAARVVLEKALNIARKLGLHWDTANVLRHLACCYPPGTDLKVRRVYLSEALQTFKALDAQNDIDLMADDFAWLAFDEGDPETAVTIHTDLFARGYGAYAPRRIVVEHQLDILGYLIPLGRYEDAQEYARKALGAAREQHLDVYAAQALGWLAMVAPLRVVRPTPDVYAKA